MRIEGNFLVLYVLRVLGNLDEAEGQIKTRLAWCKAHQLDVLLSTEDWQPQPLLRRHHPGEVIGCDEVTGNPVWFIPIGRCDSKGRTPLFFFRVELHAGASYDIPLQGSLSHLLSENSSS